MDRIEDDAPLAALVQKFNLELQKCKDQKLQADQVSIESARNIDRYEGAIIGIKEAAKIIAGQNNHGLVVKKPEKAKKD
jgi:hypothetical protein|tara:strand:- start:231 stop:467 length:237 start_codon:yes stop_codon:yes gene_type:complete